ncbi:MAG TPA: glycoside hydrolase family protein [Opitutaceae bacterium]|nr:glycoside hydrolase family protein [Opitutaceae bacterium]
MRSFVIIPLGLFAIAACSADPGQNHTTGGGANRDAGGAGTGGQSGTGGGGGTVGTGGAGAGGAGGNSTGGVAGAGGNAATGGAGGTAGSGAAGGSGGKGETGGAAGTGTTGGAAGTTTGGTGGAAGAIGGAAGNAGKGGSSGAAGSSGGAAGIDAGKDGSGGGTGGTSDAGLTSRKRGIAYGYHSDADLSAISAGIGWWYNWSPKPDATIMTGYPGLGVEFVPMVWGGTFDPATLEKQVPAAAKYLLTFNEPNFGAQANLTPEQAAALWPKIEMFAKARGMKIVSPAVNYCGSPCNETDPFMWLQKFFAACTGCQVDYVAMHWYACTKAALTTTLAKYEQQFGKQLWVTEFSCLDEKDKVNDAGELAYMQEAVAALEADPMVFRYAWFTGRFTSTPAVNLFTPTSGQLTPLGQKYVTLPR